jgi:hypothetical protein
MVFFLVSAGTINIIKLLVYGLLDMMRFVAILSNIFDPFQLGSEYWNNIFYQSKIFWCNENAHEGCDLYLL